MRLPWTIWRYTLLDLCRLLVLTTAILVAVISFAATVRYIADGRLGPLETIKYMVLAMPPMLQYALPFAAGFAATLTYHRMSQDNELTAAAASGISHRAQLVPALVVGLALSGVLTWLTGLVIPGFLRDMERLITRDAAKLVVATIESGRPLEIGDMKIHADTVYSIPGRGEGDSVATLLLTGVLALRVDKAGGIAGELSATQATVEFSHDQDAGDGGVTNVALVLRRPQGTWGESDRVERGTSESVSFYWSTPGLFDDDPKFLTSAQLRRLPEDPDRLNIISTRKRDLAVHMAERDTTAAIGAALASQGSARLVGPVGDTYILRAAGIRWNPKTGRHDLIGQRSAARGIEVEVYPPSADGRTLDPASATRLSAVSGGLKSAIGKERNQRRLSLTLDLESVATARTRDQDRGGELPAKTFTGLGPAADPLPELLTHSSRELLAEVDRRGGTGGKDPFLAGPANELSRRIEKLGREVVGKQHERMANSWACLVMVVTGALTAMRLGSSLPLTVYLWSFFPALFTVLTISAGQQMTRQMGVGGLVVLWGGVGLLAAYAMGAFWVVRRH